MPEGGSNLSAETGVIDRAIEYIDLTEEHASECNVMDEDQILALKSGLAWLKERLAGPVRESGLAVSLEYAEGLKQEITALTRFARGKKEIIDHLEQEHGRALHRAHLRIAKLSFTTAQLEMIRKGLQHRVEAGPARDHLECRRLLERVQKMERAARKREGIAND